MEDKKPHGPGEGEITFVPDSHIFETHLSSVLGALIAHDII